MDGDEVMSWSKILIAVGIEILFIIGLFYSHAMCGTPFADIDFWGSMMFIFLGLIILGVVAIILLLSMHNKE